MFKIKTLIATSIRNKLVAATILIVLIAVAIVSGVAIWIAVTQLQAQVEREEIIRLDALSEEVLSFLTGLEQDVIYLSQSQSLAQYLAAQANGLDEDEIEQKLQATHQDFLAFAKARGVYDQIRFLDAAGQEIVRINTSSDGRAVVVPEANLQNKAGRYYFDDTLNLSSGQLFVSPLDLNVEQGQIEILPDGSNKPVIRYGTPVVFEGQVVGAIITNVLAKNFLDLLADEEKLVYLVDGDGYYLYHPAEDKRWGRDLGTGVTLADDYPQVSSILLSTDPGVLTSGGNFFTHQPVQVPQAPEITWYMGTVQAQLDILEPAIDFIFGAGLAILVALIVAVVFAFIVDRMITAPIIELNQAAEQVAEGNFDVLVIPTTRDEIGSLVRVFNTMGNRIQESMTSLEELVASRTRRLELIATIGDRFSTILSLEELLAEAVNQVKDNFDYYHAHIYLLDDDRKNLVVAAGTGQAGSEMKASGYSIPGNTPTSLVARAARSGEVVAVDNVRDVSDWLPHPLLPNTYSEMAVPIILEGRVIGVLDVQEDKIAGLDESDASLLRSLAGHIATAVHNARLFEQTEAAMAEAEAVQQQYVSQVWETFRDSQPVFYAEQQKITSQIADNEAMQEVKQRVLQKGAVITTTGQVNRDENHGNKTPSALVVPLKLRGKVIGTLGLQEADPNRQWTDDEIALVEAVSEQVSQALERARLFEETQRSAWRDQVVSESTAQVWSSTKIGEVMRAAVEQLGDKLQASEVVIRLGTEDELEKEESGWLHQVEEN